MLAAAGILSTAFAPGAVPAVRSAPVMNADVQMAMPKWVQPAAATFLAATISLAPFSAEAARSGGRVGGRAPSSAMRSSPRPAPTAAPQRTTNVYVAPMGGMGMGYGGMGMGYGGYGGGNGMGLYLGLSLAETFLREQQRQAYLQQQLATQRQLGADQAAIQQLQMQLQEQNAKVAGLTQQNGGVAPKVDAETEATLKLKIQLAEQQKELEALKAAK